MARYGTALGRHWEAAGSTYARGGDAGRGCALARLRGRQLDGKRFRRQHAIDRVIVDFYCAERDLVVELDGDAHRGRAEYDGLRDRQLRALGLRVLHLTNEQVLSDTETALALISRALLPLSASGEGAGGSHRWARACVV